MKKILSFILTAALLTAGLVTALLASGCSVVNGVTKDEALGTYKLTKLEHSRFIESEDGGEDVEEKIDKIADNGIVSYIVVKSIDGVEGWGYYVYEDKETPFSATEVKLEIRYDTENPELVEGIKYKFINGNSGPSLGVNGKVLNFYMPALEIGSISNKYNVRTEYSKVSEATDLSHVQTETGKEIICVQFELQGLVGQSHVDFDYSADPSLVYFYANVAKDGKTADIAYGTKGEGREVISHEEEGVAVAYDRETRLLTIGEFTFDDPVIRAFLEDKDGEKVRVGYLYKESDSKTKAQIIESDVADYLKIYDMNNPPQEENGGEDVE